MTVTDATLRLPPQPEPPGAPLPEALAALDAEFFVEWQVPSGSGSARPEKEILFP